MNDNNLGVCRAAHGDRILSIDFPEDGKLRWRKIVRRSGSRPTGKYPSWKMGRMMQWESTNELNAFRLLDADPTVRKFYEQPVRIRYMLDGKEHYHIPDVLVETAEGKFIWEIKPEQNASEADVEKRTQLLSGLLPAYGYKYQIVLAEELGKKERIEAICQTLRNGRLDIPIVNREQIRRTLLANASVTWGAVLDGMFGARGKNYVCRMMLEGYLEWSAMSRMTRETILQLRQTPTRPAEEEAA